MTEERQARYACGLRQSAAYPSVASLHTRSAVVSQAKWLPSVSQFAAVSFVAAGWNTENHSLPPSPPPGSIISPPLSSSSSHRLQQPSTRRAYVAGRSCSADAVVASPSSRWGDVGRRQLSSSPSSSPSRRWRRGARPRPSARLPHARRPPSSRRRWRAFTFLLRPPHSPPPSLRLPPYALLPRPPTVYRGAATPMTARLSTGRLRLTSRPLHLGLPPTAGASPTPSPPPRPTPPPTHICPTCPPSPRPPLLCTLLPPQAALPTPHQTGRPRNVTAASTAATTTDSPTASPTPTPANGTPGRWRAATETAPSTATHPARTRPGSASPPHAGRPSSRHRAPPAWGGSGPGGLPPPPGGRTPSIPSPGSAGSPSGYTIREMGETTPSSLHQPRGRWAGERRGGPPLYSPGHGPSGPPPLLSSLSMPAHGGHREGREGREGPRWGGSYRPGAATLRWTAVRRLPPSPSRAVWAGQSEPQPQSQSDAQPLPLLVQPQPQWQPQPQQKPQPAQSAEGEEPWPRGADGGPAGARWTPPALALRRPPSPSSPFHPRAASLAPPLPRPTRSRCCAPALCHPVKAPGRVVRGC